MSGQENHLEELWLLEKKLKTNLKKSKTIWRVTSFDFIQKQSLVIDYQISVIDYTKLLCERMWLFTFEFEFQRSKALVIDYQNIAIDYNFLKLIGTL